MSVVLLLILILQKDGHDTTMFISIYWKLSQGRSRSLTQIDSLDPTILTGGKLDMESKSGPISCSSEQVLLLTPPPDSRVSPKTNLVGSQVCFHSVVMINVYFYAI